MTCSPAAEALLATTPEAALVVDAALTVLYENPAFHPFATGSDVRAADAGALEAVHPADRHALSAAVHRALGDGATALVDARIGTHGRWRRSTLRVRPAEGLPDAAVVHVMSDATRAATGGEGDLPGRAQLLEHLDDLRAADRPALLLLCGLDSFRLVNESLGHLAGDDALTAVGQRLRAAAHDGDLVAWLGGDVFGVVCDHGGRAGLDLGDDLRRCVRAPLNAGTPSEYVLTLSIGVARHDNEATTLDTLAAADAALFLAKERGRDRVEEFDEGLKVAAVETLRRTAQLRHAAAREELVLHYQPVVSLDDEQVVGCEALLRWQHPTEGLLGPQHFLDLAESSGLLDQLTPELVAQATSAATVLGRALPRTRPFVALNLSASQLMAPDTVDTVVRALEDEQLPSTRLVVEITETAVLADVDAALGTLHALRDLGVEVALDDFGTGYSSFERLRRLPVSKVKIDRSFVAGCLRDRDDLAIVTSILDLTRRLGIDCIAEGVELPEQASLLRDLGCRSAQGFLWSPAVPLEALAGTTLRSRAQEPLAATFELAQRMQGAGASLHTIAAALNASGYRTARGRRWHVRSVAGLLSDRTWRDPVRRG